MDENLSEHGICIFLCQSRKNALFLRLLKTSNIFLCTKAKFLLKLIHGYKFYFTTHYFFIYSMQFKTSILLWWLSTTSSVTKLGRFSSITGLKYSCTSKIMAEFQAGLLFEERLTKQICYGMFLIFEAWALAMVFQRF